MKDYEINPYIAVLIITVVGAAASLFIIRVAYSNSFIAIYSNPAYAGD